MPDLSTPKGVAKWMKVVLQSYSYISPKVCRSYVGIANSVRNNVVMLMV